MKDSEGNDEVGHKRKITTKGSQTDEDSSKYLAETLEEINRKLDVALARIKESAFVSVADRHVPIIQRRVRGIDNCPWLNKEIKSVMKEVTRTRRT